MIFVLDTAIGFGVWLPFTLGKTAALLSVRSDNQYLTHSNTSILAGSSKSSVYPPSSYPGDAHCHRSLCGFLYPCSWSLPLPILLQDIEVLPIKYT